MTLTRSTGVSAAALAAALVLAGCGGGEDDRGGSAAADVDCAAFEQYGDLSGTSVTFYTSVVAPDDAPYIASFEPFEQCTGADVVYEGSREFEAQIVVRVQSGSPPDIALFPQPGLLQTVVRDTDAVVPAPESVVANVDEYYGEDWKPYGTIDGTFYAAPNGASVKSLVWYSPGAFAEAG
jgi:alpha-glucoside transport system substrate-binding protein